MRFGFDGYTLDTGRGLLTGPDGDVRLEPRAWTVLCHLVENHDRLVSRDELVEAAWEGRSISDAAISTVIKSLRRALGDDGSRQALVRTIRGRGFRFSGDVRILSAHATVAAAEEPAPRAEGERGRKPKVAVLPLDVLGDVGAYRGIGDAIAAELIASLSRLRWLDVVARGSSFRFRGDAVDLPTLRDVLGAGYAVSGVVEGFGPALTIAVDFADTRSGLVLWSDRFDARLDTIHEVRARIAAAVIAALDLHIPQAEAARARLRPPESLDAWAAFHLGLLHVYRFTRTNVEIAEQHFRRATELDPDFATAYALLSFARFQAAFRSFGGDRDAAVAETRRLAERAVELDPDDPYANFSMARVHWLEGRSEDGLPWIDRSIELDPNFAKGYYTRGALRMHTVEPDLSFTDLARSAYLSPLDPFMFSVQANRALTFLQAGDPKSAMEEAERGARSARSHHVTLYPAIAAAWLAGDRDRARRWVRTLNQRRPDAGIRDFFRAVPFPAGDFRQSLEVALREAGVGPGG